MSAIEVLGWVSNFMFAACAVPQAVLTYRQGHARGLSVWFLLMWCLGELGSITFGFFKNLPIQIMVNYFFNFALLLLIMRYKFWERKETQ